MFLVRSRRLIISEPSGPMPGTPNPGAARAPPAIYGLPARLLGEVARYLETADRSDNLGHLAVCLVERHPVRGVRLGGRWIDLGRPDDYDRARRELGGEEAEPVP